MVVGLRASSTLCLSGLLVLYYRVVFALSCNMRACAERSGGRQRITLDRHSTPGTTWNVRAQAATNAHSIQYTQCILDAEVDRGKCDDGLYRESPDVGRDSEKIPSSHGNSSGDHILSISPQNNHPLLRRLCPFPLPPKRSLNTD